MGNQAITPQREFLGLLSGVRGDRKMVGSGRTSKKSDEEEWVSRLIGAAVGKLCPRPKIGRVLFRFLDSETCVDRVRMGSLGLWNNCRCSRNSTDLVDRGGTTTAILPPNIDIITPLSGW